LLVATKVLTTKFYSCYAEESESEILERSELDILPLAPLWFPLRQNYGKNFLFCVLREGGWKNIRTECPCSIESMQKVLKCETGFQDLEKVLNLAKMYMKYWKSMGIPNSAICLFKFCSLPLMTVLQILFAFK